MKNNPLISALIIHFNNGDFIYETLDSILSQDYSNIQIIIGDDGSEVPLDKFKVEKYINDNNHGNITDFAICINEKNVGTVKNLENLRAMSSGEIELVIASDDIFASETVFSAFEGRFRELPEDALWVTSQIDMRDHELLNSHGLFLGEDIIGHLKKSEFDALKIREASRCLLPGSGCAYKREFFERLGILSNSYRLVEDYPTHLRALRMKIPVYFLDMVTVLHRDGGISHGNTKNSEDMYFVYLMDIITCFKLEIKPYKNEYPNSEYKKAYKSYLSRCIKHKVGKYLSKRSDKYQFVHTPKYGVYVSIPEIKKTLRLALLIAAFTMLVFISCVYLNPIYILIVGFIFSILMLAAATLQVFFRYFSIHFSYFIKKND